MGVELRSGVPDDEVPQRPFESLADRVTVITGATAAGKTSAAIEWVGAAKNSNPVEIVSLDSIAVYRGMDIGTAKPDAGQRNAVPHHLIDVAEPVEDFSVARYLTQAHRAVAEIEARGHRPVFVGGTPMFLKAVLRGFDPGPPADWEFRRAVERDVAEHGCEALHRRLVQIDPIAAAKIEPTDTRRMIRAIEFARATGTPISHRQLQFERPATDSARAYWITWPRDELHQRINERVDRMFDRGLVDEVRGLIDRYGDLSRTASQAVGYRETIAWLREGGSKVEPLIEQVKAHTRQLARRQETWFRSFAELTPVGRADFVTGFSDR